MLRRNGDSAGAHGRRGLALQPSQRAAVLAMQQAVGTHPMQSLGWYVLEEAEQKLVGAERHGLARMVAAVAVGIGADPTTRIA